MRLEAVICWRVSVREKCLERHSEKEEEEKMPDRKTLVRERRKGRGAEHEKEEERVRSGREEVERKKKKAAAEEGTREKFGLAVESRKKDRLRRGKERRVLSEERKE